MTKVGGGLGRRARHELVLRAVQEAFEHIYTFSEAISAFPSFASPSPPSPTSLPSPDVTALQAQLESHLLKTLCTSAYDILLRFEGSVNHVTLPSDKPHETETAATLTRPLTPKERELILTQLPSSTLQSLRPVEAALLLTPTSTSPSSPTFLSAFDVACSASDLRLLRPDKRALKLLTFHMRKQLQLQLTEQTSPPLVLHLAVLILHSKASGRILHAPNRCIDGVMQALRGWMTEAAWVTLLRMKELMGRAREEGGGEEEKGQVNERLERVKEEVKQMGLDPASALLAPDKAKESKEAAPSPPPSRRPHKK